MSENSSPEDYQNNKWQTRFFAIWFGQAFSMLGSHLVGFAFVWHLTETTRSATILALGTLVSIIPQVIVSPFAGALVDRWSRKMVMIVFDCITAFFTLIVAILFLLDSAHIWHIFLAMFVRSACSQFQWAAMSASTTLMVPKKHLSRVAGANQALNGIMNIIGPALGALLIAIMPMQGVLFIDVSTAGLAVIPLLFFAIPQPKISPEKANGKHTVLSDLVEGWNYVVGWPSLLSIIIIAMLVNLLITPAFSLLPLVITEHFGMGAYELGFINSAFGIGVIVGGLVLSAWGGFKNRILTSLVALTFSGGALLAIGLAPSNYYLLAVTGMAIFGFLNPMVNGPLMAVLQAKVEPDIQGRVFTLLTAGAGLASPLGLIIAGPVSDATNNQIWFLVGGILTIVTGVVAFFHKEIRKIGLGLDQDEIIAPDKIQANQSKLGQDADMEISPS